MSKGWKKRMEARRLCAFFPPKLQRRQIQMEMLLEHIKVTLGAMAASGPRDLRAYLAQPGRNYYWRTYQKYLKVHRAWRDDSLLSLDNSTRAIVECMSNPESKEAYASRGLVMGYVQSGKTANFAGVVARAADAGYRLIIILAGTWNILRNQTQRRFDKDLLGKELLKNDEVYMHQPPPDWPE